METESTYSFVSLSASHSVCLSYGRSQDTVCVVSRVFTLMSTAGELFAFLCIFKFFKMDVQDEFRDAVNKV